MNGRHSSLSSSLWMQCDQMSQAQLRCLLCYGGCQPKYTVPSKVTFVRRLVTAIGKITNVELCCFYQHEIKTISDYVTTT